MIIDTEVIKKLIDSDLSAYEIEKQTGVSRMTITNYRNGKADLNKMQLQNAEKLSNYYMEVFEMSEEIKQLKELAAKLNGADDQPRINVYQNIEAKLNEWKSNGDEDVDWEVYAKEVLSDFEENEYVIEVLWTNGVPEYFHENEIKEIEYRI